MTLCFVTRLWYQNSNHISLSLSRGQSPGPLFARHEAFLLRWWSHGNREKDGSEHFNHVLSHTLGGNPCLVTRDRRRKQYICVASRANNVTMKEGQISQPSPDPDITIPSCLRHIHQRHLDPNLPLNLNPRIIIQRPTSAINGIEMKFQWH